jgi:cysteine desulfurase
MISSADRIYLDNNATTSLDRRVAEFMSRAISPEHLSTLGYNPASQHQEGRTARRCVEDARDGILSALKCRTKGMQSDRLIWTSGGTEANNLALFGLAQQHPGTVIVSAIEHPSILESAKKLAMHQSQRVRILPVDSHGVVRLDILEQWLADEQQSGEQQSGYPVSWISVMVANNETGVLQPIEEVIELGHRYGAFVHSDAVQAIGKIPLSFALLNADALTLTAHKIHGPIGIGALILRGSLTIEPQLFGGFQQLGLRPGTESSLLTSTFQEALRIALLQQSTTADQMRQLRQKFEAQLQNELPDIVIHGAAVERLPHTSSIGFPGCDRQALQMALDMAGIACSTGSACASGSSQPSHVLAAMQVPDELLQGSLRFSLSRFTTAEEIDEAVKRIAASVKKLKRQQLFSFSTSNPTIG